MPTTRRKRRGISVASAGVAIVVVLGLYLAFQRAAPVFRGSGCAAAPGGQTIPLTSGQAGIAATIAGVAHRQGMPARAITVAYATALQESKLANLHYGDLDSVGVFQQRPSEGWGTTRQIEDPVYASTRFFEALAAVPGYAAMPVYRAAQAVQHSADGQAYSQYRRLASRMARAFSGRDPRSVWCWYPDSPGRRAHLAAAARELVRTFGALPMRRGGDPVLAVRVTGPPGWAVAAWLVSHAERYGISSVKYAGFQWTAASGGRGWTRSRAGGHSGSTPSRSGSGGLAVAAGTLVAG